MASTSRRRLPEKKKSEKKGVGGVGKKAKMSMRVVSCTKKLSLTEEALFASFGGPTDIFLEQKTPSEGGTIGFVLDTRRQFEAGQYVMHLVEPETGMKVAIVCLEDLCPVKIHNRLKASNMGDDFSASNYMNRYDWFHMKMWGLEMNDEFGEEKKKFINVLRRDVFGESESDIAQTDYEDEDEEGYRNCKIGALAFFVNVKYLDEISAGNFSCERGNDWVWIMKGSGNEEPIGFIIQDKDNEEDRVFSGEYNYGCVLVDEKSAKCFAFVFGAYYTHKNQGQRESHDFDICKINYTFNKEYFQKEN